MMLEPKLLSSGDDALTRLNLLFHQKTDRIIRSITSAEMPNVVVVGLPGSGRSHAMHVIAHSFEHYRMRDLDALPILAQVSNLEIEVADSQQRSVSKTRVGSDSYIRLFPFTNRLLIDESYLWLDSCDLADIFPSPSYTNEFRSLLNEVFGGWPAGIAAVANRIALGEKATLQTVEDAADELAARYFAKFVYGLHDDDIEDLLFCIAAHGCARESMIELGYVRQCESIEKFRLQGLVDVTGANDCIAVSRPLIAASRRHHGRLSAIGLALADGLKRNGNFIGSAMVLQNIGATLAALAVVQQIKNLPIMVLSDEAAERESLRLDGALVIHDPFLWISVYTHRSRLVSSQQLLDEVETLIAETERDTGENTSLREILLFIRDIHFGEITKSRYDEQQVRNVVEHWRQTPFSVMVAFLAGSYFAINGLFAEAQEHFTLAQSLANNEANVVTYGNARLLRLVRCDDDMVREAELARSVFDLTKFASSPSAKASAYFGVATSAWLLGDADLFDESLARLQRIDESRFLAPYREFARAAQGLSFDGRCGSAYFQSWMALIASLLPSRKNPDTTLLRRAYELSRVSGSRFLQALAGMAYARTLSGVQREQLLESIEVIADGIGHYTLAKRAKALIASEDLEPESQLGWLKRYSAGLPLSAEMISRLSIFDGTATIDGERISLGEKTHLLLTLLSVTSGEVSSAFLMSAMWPDASNESARNALKMCIRRTRKTLHSEEVISKTHLGYQLDPTLRSDLGEIMSWVAPTSEPDLSNSAIERGAESLLALLKGLPLELQRYEAFDDIRPMLVKLEQDVKSRMLALLSRHACSAHTHDIIRQMSQFDAETSEELQFAVASYAKATPLPRGRDTAT